MAPAAWLGGLVLAYTGNSLTVGLGSSRAWTLQLDDRITVTTGATFTSTNRGHSGFATGGINGAGTNLTLLIPTEIDPLYDGAKNNILVFQEMINDLFYGSTAAQAYANVQTYMDTLANQNWYRIVISPSPRAGDAVPGDYETKRQTLIGLIAADPTFGGRVDAVWRVDADSRMGTVASLSDAYYYQQEAANVKVHWTYAADAIAADEIYALVRGYTP